MGRPTKLTPDVQDRITQALQVGATYEHAAQFGGISYYTFRRWIMRGEAELERRENPRVREGTEVWEREQPYVEFYEAVKDAESKAVVGWLAKIEKAANAGNWTAAAWKLERRYPREYGRFTRQEVSGPEGGPVQSETTFKPDLSKLSTDELRELERIASKLAGDTD